MGNCFKAVVQAVLLFGAETWVLTPRVERALESFMHRGARRITGKQPRRGGDGKWTYTPLREDLGTAVTDIEQGRGGQEGIGKLL